jgi:hypothetical protein
LSIRANSFSASPVISIFQAKALLHIFQTGNGLLTSSQPLHYLLSQINIFKIIEILNNGFTNVICFAATGSLSKNFKPKGRLSTQLPTSVI